MFKNQPVWVYGVAGLILVLGITALLMQDSVFFKTKNSSTDSLVMIEKLTPEIETLTEQIKNDPNNAGLVFNRANAYFNYGNLKFALQDYEKAYHMDSLNAPFALGLSDCLFEMSNPEGSILILERFIAHSPENIDVLNALALEYFLLPKPRYNLAIDTYNKVLKLDIQNADAYFYKGLIFKETGDTAKAISSFQTCTEVDPDYYDAYMQLGMLYSAKKDPIAIKYYNNAISVNDTSKEAEYGIAKYFQDAGDLENAISYYRNIIVDDPQDADALYNLATIYFGIDSIEKAYRYFDLTIKQSPARAIAYYGKGLCAEQLKKMDEAISNYKQAVNLDPELTEATERLKALNAD
ncbi:MAG: tetratricopeptide repeat protein [Chitinophagales bacterium]|nr:tetratricopeptide repeat protein [Chitinophagales bacterium]